MKQPYNTALYMRLSRDDENYGDSVSIETQRTILQQYAKEHGLSVYGEYVDDGWSGTNFERPSFQRMMDDVEAGKVNCIITKDLSLILSRLVDTFFSRISLTMQPPPKPHSTACVLPWEEGRHWQSRSSGCSSS